MSHVLSLASWKGGAGKTTTAVHLAEALSAGLGDGAVLLVDADPQGSAMDWAEKAHASGRPLRSRVVHWPDARKLATLRGIRDPVVVVDTPNRDEVIVRAALAESRLVLIPTATSTLELPRVWPMLDSAGEGAVDALVVLVRTRRQEPAKAGIAREILVSGGASVAATEIPYRSNLSHACAGVPTPFQLRPFSALVAELGLINDTRSLAT